MDIGLQPLLIPETGYFFSIRGPQNRAFSCFASRFWKSFMPAGAWIRAQAAINKIANAPAENPQASV
jgi:hypothetical protein